MNVKPQPLLIKQPINFAHRLLEMADMYHVHVTPPFRNELMRLQDRVIQAMEQADAKRIKSEAE